MRLMFRISIAASMLIVPSVVYADEATERTKTVLVAPTQSPSSVAASPMRSPASVIGGTVLVVLGAGHVVLGTAAFIATAVSPACTPYDSGIGLGGSSCVGVKAFEVLAGAVSVGLGVGLSVGGVVLIRNGARPLDQAPLRATLSTNGLALSGAF